MEFFDHCLEAAFFNVGVDLCGRDIGVPEEFLDHAQVGASAQQVRGKAVAHEVWIDIRFDARSGGVLFDELADAWGGEFFSPDR